MNHRLLGSTSLVLTVTGHDNVKRQILTPTEQTPLKRVPKIVAGKYDGDPFLLCAKFGANPFMFLYKWTKYNKKVVGEITENVSRSIYYF